MQTYQKEISIKAKHRGFHLVTDEIVKQIDLSAFTVGIATVFIKHTSASLSINENADYSVRKDMESFFNDICDDKSYFIHTYEGQDDMPAHLKSTLIGSSLTIPITNGRLNLGTWQGIYLNEHRDNGGSRRIVITAIGA